MLYLGPFIKYVRSTKIDFAENQLYPILVGLSPLATSHPRILPHTWVRSSKACWSSLQPAIHGSLKVSPHGLSPLEASFLLNARASIRCILFDTVGLSPPSHLIPLSLSLSVSSGSAPQSLNNVIRYICHNRAIRRVPQFSRSSSD